MSSDCTMYLDHQKLTNAFSPGIIHWHHNQRMRRPNTLYKHPVQVPPTISCHLLTSLILETPPSLLPCSSVVHFSLSYSDLLSFPNHTPLRTTILTNNVSKNKQILDYPRPSVLQPPKSQQRSSLVNYYKIEFACSSHLKSHRENNSPFSLFPFNIQKSLNQ